MVSMHHMGKLQIIGWKWRNQSHTLALTNLAIPKVCKHRALLFEPKPNQQHKSLESAMCAPPRTRASLLHPSATSLMTVPTPPPPWSPYCPGLPLRRHASNLGKGASKEEARRKTRGTRGVGIGGGDGRWTMADEGWRRDRCGGCDGRLGFKWGLHAAAETPTTSRTTPIGEKERAHRS